MVSTGFIVARTVLFSISTVLCGLSIATILRNKELRRCPVFCFIALAECIDVIRLIAIYYVHDLPSAIVGYEVFEDTIGYVLFFILLRLICHFLILTAMSIGFVIGAIRASAFAKFARYRSHLVLSIVVISTALASLAFVQDHWGRKFSMERLSWPPKKHNLENDVLNSALTGMKGVLLLIVSLSAVIILICFCKARRRVKIINVGIEQKAQPSRDRQMLLVSGFFVLALFYFLPNLVLLTYQWAPNSIQTYEIVEMISTIIEFSKWILYSLSSGSFRSNLLLTIRRLFCCLRSRKPAQTNSGGPKYIG